jgi:serine/threonine protein kinase
MRERPTRPAIPDWARWSATAAERPWTVGIEGEVMLLEPRTWSLANRIDDVLAALPPQVASHASAEIHACVVELTTAAHPTVAGVAAELALLRRSLAEAFQAAGGRGRFRVERRLGNGGMASVWLAQDECLHRKVAIKVLAEAWGRDEVEIARFHREARLTCGLSHPNLVAGYEWGDDPRPYLVMEYVDGPSLAQLFDRPQGFRGDARALARELLAALAWLHDRGIIHGDVKPGNVLIASNGSVRLTDLGIAQPEGAACLVPAGRVVGTLAYMAPEVRRGEPISAGSDLYGAGRVIGHCAERKDTPIRELVDALTAPKPGDRVASAHDALSLLGAGGEWPARWAQRRGGESVGKGSTPVQSHPSISERTTQAFALRGRRGVSNGHRHRSQPRQRKQATSARRDKNPQ